MSDIYIKVFALIIVRMIGLFMTAPYFSSKLISSRVKIALIFWISLSIMFIIPVPETLPEFSINFVVLLIHDFILGLLIGFIPRLIITGAQYAGSLMDMQMGLSVGQSFDPVAGTQSTIMMRLMQLLTLVLFLDVNGHHVLLSGIYHSYKVFPVSQAIDISSSIDSLLQTGSLLFFIGVQIASPIVLVIFLLDFSFGLISRVAPQVNVFMLGFQMKPSLGLSVFLVLLPLLIDRVVFYLSQIVNKIYALLHIL